MLPEHEQIYAFTRTMETDCLLVILNFSQETAEFNLRRILPVQAPAC